MNKAVFLDRDGVINLDHLPYQHKVEDFHILEGIGDTLKVLKDRGYLLIIISNQGGIAKSIYKKEDSERLHKILQDYLNNYNVKLDEVYYCPHHPVSGNCICRKPDSQMLEKGIARFNVDRERSYFVGDMERDMEAGRKAGLNVIKVTANDPLADYLDQIK